MYQDDDDVSGVFDTAPGGEELSPEERARVIAGRYEIVELIGAGGMGQVLRVRHRRLGKPFALKLMQPEYSLDPESRALFHREARLASNLSHPGIVSIVDFGEDPDWGLFIVMEFLEGDLLSKRIEDRGTLPVKVVCDVAGQLADALHHSHENNVVHGDLKTDNVLCVASIADERREWNIRLLDFGTARLADTASAGASERAPESRIAGTPEYLAPERITGEPTSPQVDIYALGVIMYEMLTGTVPFSGEPTEVLKSQLSETPEPIESRRQEPVDAALAEIVGRAMAKRTEDRYPDGLALRRDLRRYMDGLGLSRRANRSPRAGTAPGEARADAAAAAFDALGVPAVGLGADGTIVVANRAFARLLRQENHEELEGESVLSTRLFRIHPDLREDIRLCAMDGKLVRRRLTVRGRDGRAGTMRFVLTPAAGGSGHCVLVLYTVPKP